jgi:triacylglycerol lipase
LSPQIDGKLEVLTRRIAEGGSTDPVMHMAEIKALLAEFALHHADNARMEWMEAEYPTIYAFLEAHKAALVDGPPEALDRVADLAADKLKQAFLASSWDDVGLSIRYQNETTVLCGLSTDCEILKQLPDRSGKTSIRFAVAAEKLGTLVPDTGMMDSREKETRTRLKDLGVQDVDVQTVGRAGLFRSGALVIHMPPTDGALLVDAAVLSERGYALVKDASRRLVFRDGERNAFAMPPEAFCAMRGIAFELPDRQDQTVLARVLERLEQRGARASAVLKGSGSERVIELNTDDARLLLAPVAEGDPATKLTTRKIEHVPSANGYHCENAVLTVQAADLAYKSRADIEKFAKLWGFNDVTHVEHAGTDAQGFVAFDRDKNTLLVSIRGSESRRDMQMDAGVKAVDGARFGGGKVAVGFAAQADGLLPQIRAALDKHAVDPANPPNVVFCGHSLGGAVACLCEGALAVSLRDDSRTKHFRLTSPYTYGQPKTGDATWVKGFEQLLQGHKARWYRFVNNNDHVTRIPPGYAHGGVLLYIDRRGALHPPQSGMRERDQSGLLGALTDGANDHRCRFYIAFVRKARDVVIDIT